MSGTKYIDRPIPKISLRGFESRFEEITSELCDAAENIGFFAIVDHDLSNGDIDSIFEQSRRFFSLSSAQKATVPLSPKNVGWEHKAQVRPSTGVADAKESYQLQFGANMTSPSAWISDDILPCFQTSSLAFMHKAQSVSEKLMACLAHGLGFERDFFIRTHDIARPNAQSVCRMLHYFAVPQTPGKDYYRAGPHVDWGLLTLLFQREGQCGLEICPGRESVTEFGAGDTWTRVEPKQGEIVCNIGDMLMYWSDDRFKSTIHRVATPQGTGDGGEEGYYGERYSVAFFNQPCSDAVIEGPGGRYPKLTGEEFIQKAMRRNYEAITRKKEEIESEGQADVNKGNGVVTVEAAA